ncbi:MAG: hypothetical protein Q8S73_36780 [Deltaproteobacteria bacterium]|nr:hypothetical protein [Myxococcales bacterium]MDP3219715.1 hypothetical protein [Deltaproteobacteria bacterium]
MLTSADRAAEILSFIAQRDELGQTIAVSVGGWYRVRPVHGVARFAPTPDGAGVPLDEAVGVLAAEARALLSGDEAGQGHEQAGELVHAPTLGPDTQPCMVTP